MKLKKYSFSSVFWWFNAGVTPDLIPNSEVKPCSSDDTPMEGKVANRQNTELNKKNNTVMRKHRGVFFVSFG